MTRPLNQTKHFHLTRALRGRIRSLVPGELIPTVEELKREFAASQATVTRSLGELRREGLIHRPMGRQRLRVAQGADPAAHRIAIVRPDYPSRVNDEIDRAIVEAGRKRDWTFSFAYYRSLAGLDLGHASVNCDGIVLQLTNEPIPDRLRAVLRHPRKPLVVAQETPEEPAVSWVCSDAAGEARLAVEHLASLGHRRILLVVPTLSTGPMRRAAAGWREAAAKAGASGAGEMLVDCDVPPFEDALLNGYEILTRWIRAPHPEFSAAYCATGHMGMAFLRVLRENRIAVPRSVSVVASGGLSLLGAFTNPPLTALEYHMEEYGRAVVGLLEEDLAGARSAPRRVLVRPSLVARESSAPIPSLPRPASRPVSNGKKAVPELVL